MNVKDKNERFEIIEAHSPPICNIISKLFTRIYECVCAQHANFLFSWNWISFKFHYPCALGLFSMKHNKSETKNIVADEACPHTRLKMRVRMCVHVSKYIGVSLPLDCGNESVYIEEDKFVCSISWRKYQKLKL